MPQRPVALIAYLILLHLICVALLATVIYQYISPRPDNWHERLQTFYLRVDASLSPGATLAIGDSHIQGLCVSCVKPGAVNFGIGKDKLEDVTRRLRQLKSAKSAQYLMIQAGHNNLRSDDNQLIIQKTKTLLDAVPDNTHVILTAQFPIATYRDTDSKTNLRKRQLNKVISGLCDLKKNCTMLDINRFLTDARKGLSDQYHIGDGVHLNPQGYAIWINALTQLTTTQ